MDHPREAQWGTDLSTVGNTFIRPLKHHKQKLALGYRRSLPSSWCCRNTRVPKIMARCVFQVLLFKTSSKMGGAESVQG